MSKNANFIQSRTRSTFYTSLLVIALVLFFLGLLGAGGIYTRMALENAQENFEVMVTLPDHASQEKQLAFESFLKKQPFVKELQFISKEKAGEIFVEQVGQEFLEIMDGVNPLPASFNFSLRLPYVTSDSLQVIHDVLRAQEILQVQDITYPIDEIEQLGKNISTLSKIVLGVAGLVALIAFFIVTSTVRLAIFGKRLMIRSMELIGATARFIRAPFLRMGILQGFLGAVVGVAVLVVLIIAFGRHDLSGTTQLGKGLPISALLFRQEFLLLSGGIVIFGTFLGWFSSWWAVSRFLNKNLNQLM
jgi:cell division transport system permease protein